MDRFFSDGNQPGGNGGGNGAGTGPGPGPGTGQVRPTPRPPTNPVTPVYPPGNPPPLNPPPIINPPPIFPLPNPNPLPNDYDNIDDDPFGFGLRRTGGFVAPRPAPIPFADQQLLPPTANGRQVPGQTWVPPEQRSQLPMIVNGNNGRGSNWRNRNPVGYNYGQFGQNYDPNYLGGGRPLRYNSMPAYGYDNTGINEWNTNMGNNAWDANANNQANGAIDAVQRAVPAAMVNGQPVHLCIRPSPRTKSDQGILPRNVCFLPFKELGPVALQQHQQHKPLQLLPTRVAAQSKFIWWPTATDWGARKTAD